MMPACSRRRRPLRLGFYHTSLTRRIVAETAPPPVFRPCHQPTLHRISVNVTQLFDELLFAPHVEIVIAGFPEWICRSQGEPSRDSLLERLHSLRQRAPLGFVDQQVHVFRHHHVSIDAKRKLFPDPFQRRLERDARLGAGEIRPPAITTESEEVKLSGLLKALESPRQETRADHHSVTREHPGPSEAWTGHPSELF